MKKSIFRLGIILLLCALCAGALLACGSAGGTYYRYRNGSYSESDYITIDGDTWTDNSGASGPVEWDGESIVLYVELFGEKEVVWSGTCKGGS